MGLKIYCPKIILDIAAYTGIMDMWRVIWGAIWIILKCGTFFQFLNI